MLSRRQRAIKRLYSVLADRIYEPLVVQGTFKLFGGELHSLLEAQAPKVAAAAGGGPILDIPIGTAYFTESLARHHTGLLVGADIAEGMVKKSASEARRKGFEVSLLQADIHRLPLADGSIPAIACTNGLQVIPDLPGALAELRRVLRPGGTAFISVVTLGVSTLMPKKAHRLPALLRSGKDIAAAAERAGFEVRDVTRERRATLIEARRPAS